jgi:hypothetical protein
MPEENIPQETKSNDKELNFRALEAKYQRQLEAERNARLEAEKIAKEAIEKKNDEKEEEEAEPYVDHKRLEKKFTSFERRLEEKIDRKAEEKARMLLDAEKKNSWIQANPDFFEVMQNAEKLATRHPELAEMILKMPEGFERQKLAYSNIKALGLHKPDQKQPSIQEKIDNNKKSAYYQPTGTPTPPFSAVADFSNQGQKQAYEKMQELKSRLRLG